VDEKARSKSSTEEEGPIDISAMLVEDGRKREQA